MEKEVVYVAEHIRMYQIDWLAVNGGFVRANIATFGLDKFKGKNAFRTFNLNYDVASSDGAARPRSAPRSGTPRRRRRAGEMPF